MQYGDTSYSTAVVLIAHRLYLAAASLSPLCLISFAAYFGSVNVLEFIIARFLRRARKKREEEGEEKVQEEG